MKRVGSLLLLPITVPGAVFGILYFVLVRRHPPTWLVMTFGVTALAAIVWGIASLAG